MLALCGWPMCSASVALVENLLSVDFVVRLVIREDTMSSTEIALVRGLKVRVSCQDRLWVNSDADETLV